jgi:hypothetical protein
VQFRFDLGFAVDGAASRGPTLAGQSLAGSFREVRPFATGNLLGSTRGWLATPLSTFLSAGFQFAPEPTAAAPFAARLDETDEILVRSGWAEISPVQLGPRLGTLRVRAGRQYAYEIWPVHFDGARAAWNPGPLEIVMSAGARVNDFVPGSDTFSERPALLSLSVSGIVPVGRTLRGTGRVNAMRLGDHELASLELALRPERNVALLVEGRVVNRRPGRERVTLRAQLSQISNVTIDVQIRHATDWRYDPWFIDDQREGAPRGYLDLGPNQAQYIAGIRAGTVLLGNIDVQARGGVAFEGPGDKVPDGHAPVRWAEIGGAVEAHLRRTVSLSLSGLVRDHDLRDPSPIRDVVGTTQPLPTRLASLGEESFAEFASGVRIGGSGQRFVIAGEIYGRRSKFAPQYLVDDPIDFIETRGGGRFVLEARVNRNLRMKLSYELSTEIERAPEISGYKSLRVVAESRF